MNDFIEVCLKLEPYLPWSEIITYELSEIDYIGFQEEDPVLKAYISAEKFNLKEVEVILDLFAPQMKFSIKTSKIESKNWNAEWEASFSPVVIANQVAIRALFHEPIPEVNHEILLTPKMAFGTGHHATTSMMMQAMLEISFKNTAVLDVGCGTAILSILAEKLGAGQILAIDNDEWAVNNAHENCQINGSVNIIVEKAEVDSIPQNSFNVILANINRNVILNDMPIYRNHMKKEGHLLLSGFREEDKSKVLELAKSLGLKEVAYLTEKDWCLLHLTN